MCGTMRLGLLKFTSRKGSEGGGSGEIFAGSSSEFLEVVRTSKNFLELLRSLLTKDLRTSKIFPVCLGSGIPDILVVIRSSKKF